MRKSTLTVMSGLVVLFGVAILAYPKLDSESKTISKESTNRFEVKTKKTNRETPVEKKEEFVVSFGVNASFDEPQTEK